MSGYIDDLVALRQHSLETRREMMAKECEQIAEQIRETQQYAREALRSGDLETARNHDLYLQELETDYQSRALELQPPQEAHQLTPAKQGYLNRFSDQELNRQHWSGLPISNRDALGYAHHRAVQLGYKEDSPEYFAAVSVVAPTADNPLITTGDEALSIIRNSKYGKDMTAKEYNKQARRIYEGK
jgi:hypothetical protein